MKIINNNKKLVLFTSIVLIFGFVLGYVYADNIIQIVVDGNTISAPEAFIKNGSTYVPIRAVSEALGLPVKWDGNISTVYIGKVPNGLDLVTDLKPFKVDEAKNYLLNDSNNSISIAGTKYNHGYRSDYMYIGDNIYYMDGEFYWNLGGKYKTLTFSTGVPDNAYTYGSYASSYRCSVDGDGNSIGTYHVSTSDGLKTYTVDVTGVKILKIAGDVPIINPRVN
ncbi:stalk domain-containing protein (plasmid) [Thermoanaerobacterium thermosaccharolyticum]|uniref:stalk domain-containing protein n=1 Tax=Thermoanaerobacterium thermosaccharolyticum TaxID=1517 RepID=UPI003D2C0BB5